MFRTSSQTSPVDMLPGVVRRTLTHGERMLLVEFEVRAGSVFPEHEHPYEQIGYLCSGKGKLWIGSDVFEMEPGSSWCIPARVPHRAEFTENSVAIDVFSPPRKDYL